METEVERSVRVKLKAGKEILDYLQVHSIDDTPSVAVPTVIGKTGLTEVVSHFLEEINLKLNFSGALEFFDLQRECILRSTLEKHLKKFKLSEEDSLILEYSFPKSSEFVAEGPGTPVPDWISCLTKIGDYVFAGSFDGSVITNKYISKNGVELQSIEESAHAAQITGITAFELENKIFVATSSKDASIGIRPLLDNNKLGERIASCMTGSGVSLETVCSAKSSDDPEDILLATSGWGGMISFFQVPCKSVVGADDNAESINNSGESKRKKGINYGRSIEPVWILKGHTDNVSCCIWGSDVDPVTIFSGSWDHTLRVWDCIRQVETAILHCPKAFTSLDVQREQQLLVSGHPDHIARIWDARASGDAVVKLSLKGHRGWVSSVAFQGEGSPLVATASYDRSVRIWDIRGGVPVQTIQTDVTGRLFTVTWGDDNKLFIGGTDSVIRTYSAKS